MNFETMEIWDAMKDVKYRRTLENLRKVIRNAHGNLNEAISSALNMVCSAVHAEAGTFWFYSRFGDGLVHPRAWYGGGNLANHFLLPGEGIAGQVIETGKSIMISDCQSDARWTKKVDKSTGFETKSMICVPLIANKMVFGCIQIINKTDGTLFDEKDLAFEQRLAEEISGQFVALNLLTDGRVEPNIAVMFVDMRGFTEVAAQMEPMQVAEMLNEYLSFVTVHIKDNDGIPDKYIGDCAMAYWKMSETCTDPVYMACRAAMNMVENAEGLERRMKERFGCKIRFGIGINYGPAFLGNIGTSMLTDHTVVGHTVNMAAQLEAQAPAGKIYISREVANALGKKAQVSSASGLKLKGKMGKFEMLSLEKLD